MWHVRLPPPQAFRETSAKREAPGKAKRNEAFPSSLARPLVFNGEMSGYEAGTCGTCGTHLTENFRGALRNNNVKITKFEVLTTT